MNVASQRDNLGDSVLRRPLVHAAQAAASECHIFVGKKATDWTNLGLRESDKAYSNRREWMAHLVKSALRGKVALATNAGELLADRRFLFNRALLLPAAYLVKMRGGAIIHAGFGLRSPHKRLPAIARHFVKMSDVVSWRDETSRAATDLGVTVPDWAFAEGSTVAAISARFERDASSSRILALSLRGDRESPGPEFLARLKELASHELKARVIVVCQVRRDAERCRWVADQIGGELLDWPASVDHAEQERRVRDVYASSTWISSDRLHAVIMAATEGAVPLDLIPDTSRKVTRTIALAELSLASSVGAELRLQADRRRLLWSLVHARADIAALAARVAQVASGAPAKEIRVLQAIAAPDGTTRYARHMAATETFDVVQKFLTWREVLFGHHDILHVHWPEHLVPASPGVRSFLKRLQARIVLGRVERRGIPIVRTLHNVTPHDPIRNKTGESVRGRLDKGTVAEVHLVRGDAQVSTGSVYHIPHGNYRQPYAESQSTSAHGGSLLFFGRVGEYKGVRELLDAFEPSELPELRIVGKSESVELTNRIERAASEDQRITHKLGFVSDSELGAEISNGRLCVFPYRELHSSGAILVALSLNKPIMVPRTATTEALQLEVGEEWVYIYDNLSPKELEKAVTWAGLAGRDGSIPDLSDRSWTVVRSRHRDMYLAVASHREKS